MANQEEYNLTPEQIAEYQQDRAKRYMKSGGKFLKKVGPYLQEGERNLFKINAGGLIATLALIGQSLGSYPILAGLMVVPAIGFVVSLLASVLISFTRATEFADYSVQLQQFALNLPDDLTAAPEPTSNAPQHIRMLSRIAGFGFCASVVAAVILSALYVLHVLEVWSAIGGMFA